MLCGIDPFYLDAQTCMDQLPQVIQSRIAISGAGCTNCITAFVDNLVSVRDIVESACEYDPSGRACLSDQHVQTSLIAFQTCSGHSLFYPACSRAEVRQLQEESTLVSVIESVLTPGTSSTDLLVVRPTCTTCYQQLTQSLSSASSDTSILAGLGKCISESLSHADCLTALQGSLVKFEACAGFPVDRSGPECDATDLERIAEVAPYEFIAGCAFEPQSDICLEKQRFLDDLKTLSDAQCAECYSEFSDQISASTALYAAGSVCDNVTATGCLTWNTVPVSRLAGCTSG